jgi:hypothetical protein
MGYKFGDTKLTGLFLTPEVRIYPKKNAINGMYIAPYLRYQNLTLSDAESKGTLSSIGGGLLFGRQWITKYGFTMDLFFGGHYSNAKVTVNSGPSADTFDTGFFTGFGVRAGFTLGFSF